MSIADLPDAELTAVSQNEIALDQKQSDYLDGLPKLDDPVAFRFGAWANPLGRAKWYIAKISLDVLRWIQGHTHRTEVGFIKLAIDELFDGDGQPVPMIALYLTTDTTGSQDSDMQPVAIFTRRGIRFLVPVFGYQMTSPLPRRVALRAVANGQLVCAESAGNSPLIANRTAVGPWETFEVIQLS